MILIVIPARKGSQRLPAKPLLEIHGRPLIWWTVQIAKQSKLANKIVVATDDKEIFDIVKAFGEEAIMTSSECQSGTDRISEAAKNFPEASVIVNLQGDEPLLPTGIVDETIKKFLSIKNCQIATPCVPFNDPSDKLAESKVKVVFNHEGKALYFSRGNLANSCLHLGLYVYSREALAKFCSLEPSPLEKAERLEQLRALENNIDIYVYEGPQSKGKHFGIDTPEDLELAKELLPVPL